MTAKKRERRTGRKPAASAPSNGETESFVSRLPTELREKLRRNPYRALGVACAFGVGAGVVLSSRILRSAVASAASRAIVEFGRTYLIHETK